MDTSIDFLLRHGQAILFLSVLAEQLGLPVPAIPLLVAAGALAGTGRMSLGMALALPVLASLPADLLWFWLGRHRGRSVLGLLCRISLEPDSCVRRTEDFFVRHGVRSLILAKFIPGLSTIAPPLAGIFHMGLRRFLWYDALGASVWTGTLVGAGYLFTNQLEQVAAALSDVGFALGFALGAGLAAWIAYKFVRRQVVLRRLRVARITVDELRDKLGAGHDLLVVDLRRPSDLLVEPYRIPGALSMAIEELDRRHQEIPRDREIVLYCSCPNEATAAKAACLLHRRGITRVRPLAGGIAAWRAKAYPVEPHVSAGAPAGVAEPGASLVP